MRKDRENKPNVLRPVHIKEHSLLVLVFSDPARIEAVAANEQPLELLLRQQQATTEHNAHERRARDSAHYRGQSF